MAAENPSLVLILAPRRVERVEEVATILKKRNISFGLRSSLKQAETVILLDTMGELAKVYSLGQVAFIGNSLIKPGGGHSLIEPLSHGLAVLHGPYVENISHVSEIANSQGLTYPIANHEELEEKIHTLLGNIPQRLEITEKSKTFIAQQQGAAKKTTAIITNCLDVQPPNH